MSSTSKPPAPFHLPQPKDDTVRDLIQKFVDRADFGFKKYGVTTADRTDYDLRRWLIHALEESMDHCVYLMRAINELKGTPASPEPEVHRVEGQRPRCFRCRTDLDGEGNCPECYPDLYVGKS